MPTSEHLVHRLRPDLDLERLAVERDDRGVERLVEVVLGDRDVVVELAGDRPPDRMDDPERRVAVADLVDEDADGVNVVDLAELRALALHLLPDAVQVLRATLQVGLDAGGLELGLELRDRAVDVALTALPPGIEELGQLTEALGLEDLEGEILELPLHLPDAEPLGQRGVDLHRLAGDADLLVGRQPVQRPHVVEPVGELDQDDPDVLGHRQQHLADVLGLLLLVAVRAELGQLRDPVDELGDLGPELLLDVGQAVLRVLRDVVEERRLDGGRVDPELGQDLGRRDRVRDVRLAGRPLLAVVRGHREVEGAADRLEVARRVLGGDGRVEVLAEGLEVDFGLRPSCSGRGRTAGPAAAGLASWSPWSIRSVWWSPSRPRIRVAPLVLDGGTSRVSWAGVATTIPCWSRTARRALRSPSESSSTAARRARRRR